GGCLGGRDDRELGHLVGQAGGVARGEGWGVVGGEPVQHRRDEEPTADERAIVRAVSRSSSASASGAVVTYEGEEGPRGATINFLNVVT
ncbi:MAG: hypothetical protein AB7L91_18980, partial [Dehalococcoidia bacterium]